jgi:hypothetical protein
MRRAPIGFALAALLVVAALAWLVRRPAQTRQAPSPEESKQLSETGTQSPLLRPPPLQATLSPPSRAVAREPPFASEDDYLRELERLNAVDKSAALELVERGSQWYPNSSVRQEAREAMGITLLVDLGRIDEARERVRRFIAEHPRSRYRPLVQGKTGVHPRPTGPAASEKPVQGAVPQ